MVYGEQGHRWGATAFTARDGSAYANHIAYGGGTLGGSSREARVGAHGRVDWVCGTARLSSVPTLISALCAGSASTAHGAGV